MVKPDKGHCKAILIDLNSFFTTKTGVKKFKIVDVTKDCKKSTEYYWTEGNMACDCNRGTFFGLDDVPCGDSRFKLVYPGDFPWKSMEYEIGVKG